MRFYCIISCKPSSTIAAVHMIGEFIPGRKMDADENEVLITDELNKIKRFGYTEFMCRRYCKLFP